MRATGARFTSGVTAAVAAILPGRCAGCGRAGEPVCAACATGLRRPPPLPVPAALDGWVAAFAYEGVAREIVARVKYRNERAAVPWLADAMIAAYAADRRRRAGTAPRDPVRYCTNFGVCNEGSTGWVAADAGMAPDLVTWAPASAERRRGSGFDHGELLARAVARRLGLSAVRLLSRGPGPGQTGQSRAARGHGPALDAVGDRARGRAVLLVDDVVTTGTTLGVAAVALRRAGAVSVVALTAAATPPRRG